MKLVRCTFVTGVVDQRVFIFFLLERASHSDAFYMQASCCSKKIHLSYAGMMATGSHIGMVRGYSNMTIKNVLIAGVGALAVSLTGAVSAQATELIPPGSKPEISFNIGGTSDYVFRGISQTLEDPAIQGGADATYGIFYAGVWASNVDFVQGNPGPGNGDANIEVDLYGGITPSLGPVNFDFGFIYYAYPNAQDLGGADLDYFEWKAGASGELAKGLSIGGTVYYSDDYFAETGEVVTLEGTLAYELPKVGIFTPSVDGLIGTSLFQDDVAGVDQDYVYWNIGLGLAVGNFAMDFRYHDTDEEGFANLPGLSDERFVFTATVSLP